MQTTTEQAAVCPGPGIYENVPERVYRKWAATSPSTAKPALISALAYQSSLSIEREETDAMRLGSLAHAAVMEPDTMLRRFACWEGGRRYGKEWDSFCLANAGKTPVTAAQVEIANKVRDRANKHPAIRAIMARVTHREVSIRWNHKCTRSPQSIACMGRPDLLEPGRIPDVKTTGDLSSAARARVIASKGYDVSMAAYRLGLREIEGEYRQPVLIWICTKPPHDAIVRTLEDDWIGRGEDRWLDAIERVAIANHKHEYPGMDDHEGPEVMPAYLDAGGAEGLGLVGLTSEGEE